MDKNKVLNREVTDNQRKTIASFVEIEKGTPKLVKKPLKDICKKTRIRSDKRKDKRTETDKGYQLKLLKDLIGKEICDKDGMEYFVKPHHIDLVFSSLIQNKIKDLEDKGLFRLLDSYVFGIKKEWSRYPEIEHLHSIVLESLNIQWRIKQIKKICLIRDFGEKWNRFLKTDAHPAIKHWLWKIVIQYLSSPHEKEIDKKRIDNVKAQLNYFGITNETKIKECETHIDNLRRNIRKESRVKPTLDQSFFGKRLLEVLKKYNEEYSKFILNFIKKDVKHWEMIKEILQWVLVIYPEELNRLGLYVDMGSQTSDGTGARFVIPIDNEEKFFRKLNSDRNKKMLEEALKNKNEIFEDLLDKNNFRNVQRYMMRESQVMTKQIPEPKFAILTKPSLEHLRKKINDIAKTEEWAPKSDDLSYLILKIGPVLNREFYLDGI